MNQSKVQEFQEAAYEVSSFVKSRLDGNTRFRINTDTDPDGVTAGSIFVNCLKRYDVPFHISFSGPPEEGYIRDLGDQDYDLFVFIDQGSEQFPFIEKHILKNDKEALILDHHQGVLEKRENLVYLNPHEFSLNGARDVSASGVVYSVVENIDEDLNQLSVSALIGALGDRQELDSGFVGVNRCIESKAIDGGFLSSKTGLKLDGRKSPLVESISSFIRPFLLGLSGNRGASEDLIRNSDLGPEENLDDISLEKEQKLKDNIIERVQVEPNESLKRALWGNVYIYKSGKSISSVNEYVTLLDACEKLDEVEIGFSALIGSEKSEKNAIKTLGEYKSQMIESINWFVDHRDRIKGTNQMRYVYVGNEMKAKMLSEALSISIESNVIPYDRPVLALVDLDDERLKVSARAPQNYSESGGNIGRVMREVSSELGGYGGGHDVAAAARLPKERMDEFIRKVDKLLEKEKSES